jgi:hypothetical protein
MTMIKRPVGFDFKDINVAGYKNINELYPQKDQLHCCETLFGDPLAEVLLLAQDAADYPKFEALKQADGRNPFRHDPKWATNKNLFKYLSPYFEIGESTEKPNNGKCKLFYANAIWLLKQKGGAQGKIVNEVEALNSCLPVLKATIKSLPNLRLIIALGEKAYKTVQMLDSSLLPWAAIKCAESIKANIYGKEILVASTYHPGNRGKNNRVAYEKKLGGAGDADALFAKDYKKILVPLGYGH